MSGVEGLDVGFPSLYNTVFGVKELASKIRVEPGNRVIEGVIEEEVLKGTLRLKANGTWIQMPMVNTRGNLTSHTKILDMIIDAIPLSKEDLDSMTTTYNLDCNFVVNIPTKKDYKEVEPINHNINCHTDGSSVMTTGLEQVCLSTTVLMTLPKKPFMLVTMRLCFKLKFLVGRAAYHLIFAEIKNKFCHQLRQPGCNYNS